jgi:hypothetical protein
MKWVKIYSADETTLPPLGVRVIVYIPDTNLFNGSGHLVPVCQFMMERYRRSADDNNLVPYAWTCENSGNAFGQEVTYWRYLEADPK